MNLKLKYLRVFSLCVAAFVATSFFAHSHIVLAVESDDDYVKLEKAEEASGQTSPTMQNQQPTLAPQLTERQLRELQQQQNRNRFVSGGFTLVFIVVGLVLFINTTNRWRRRVEIKNQQLERERNVIVAQNKQLAVERDRAEAALKAKTAFVQSMTHEIRTPLNAINGFTQVLLSAGYKLPDEERKDFSDRIEQNTKLLTNILDDLIQISDLESHTEDYETELYPATAICNQALERIRSKVSPNVSIRTAYEVPDVTLVNTHPRLLHTALQKLLDNAAKFTRQGSITLGITATDKQMIFSVTDTGPGIPADKSEFVFERFTKLDSFMQGTGLGLPVARMITERLGGSLTIDPQYRSGARFCLAVPYCISC